MPEIPFFLREKLAKYQLCCHPECEGDARTEVSVTLQDGSAYFLAFCDRKGHSEFRDSNCKDLASGTHTPESLSEAEQLNIEHLFYRPPGHKKVKCKYLQWVKYLKSIEDEVAAREKSVPLAVPEAQARTIESKRAKAAESRAKTRESKKGWSWVGNIDRWMNVRGEIVRIDKLSTAELICAIWAIRDNNFSRITKRIAWTKKLSEPKEIYLYPPEELSVGYEIAGDKLEEFLEVVEERGLF